MIEDSTPIDQLRGHQALVSTAPWYSVPDREGSPMQVNLSVDLMGELVQIIDVDGAHGNLIVWVYGQRRPLAINRHCLTVTTAPAPICDVPIPPDVAAHVLFPFAGIGYRAGSFTNALIEALVKADLGNLARLSLAFPEYAKAVDMAKNDPNGIALLKRAMRAAG